MLTMTNQVRVILFLILIMFLLLSIFCSSAHTRAVDAEDVIKGESVACYK